MKDQFDIRRYHVEGRGDTVQVSAGHRGMERVVPPAGEEHAFETDRWERLVSIYVSPTGRSVRVFVDGVEVPARQEQG